MSLRRAGMLSARPRRLHPAQNLVRKPNVAKIGVMMVDAP